MCPNNSKYTEELRTDEVTLEIRSRTKQKEEEQEELARLVPGPFYF